MTKSIFKTYNKKVLTYTAVITKPILILSRTEKSITRNTSPEPSKAILALI